jgi:hypothetical protein
VEQNYQHNRVSVAEEILPAAALIGRKRDKEKIERQRNREREGA